MSLCKANFRNDRGGVTILRYCETHEGGKRLESGNHLQEPLRGKGEKPATRDLYPEAVDFSLIGGFLPTAFTSSCPKGLSIEHL